jgi:sigma-B regulation protein RsbU (phosphoserine phosphatase)
MSPRSPTSNAENASPRGIRVLLVDDQAFVGETVRRMLADEPGVEFCFCQNPAEAIAAANRFGPTVILQDLVMPDIDGLLLLKFFRANLATRETPMIVLSSKEEPVIKAKAFSLGANDYLVKLPDKLEVAARIRYHSRAYLDRLERDEAYRQLAESQRQLAEEVAQAARYVQSLLPAKLKGAVNVDWRFVPSTQLGGDMFGYHWLDADHFAVYLLDVSGHGVGSSLLAVSAANVLSSQALPDVNFRDPAAVMTRLNDVFQMEKQNEKYFTIFYGVFDKTKRALTYANAAHPAALLFTGADADTAPLQQLDSLDPILGMLPPGMPFESKSAQLGDYARLLIYSDGVYEIDNPKGGMWKYPEFLEFLAPRAKDPDVMDQLYAHVRTIRGGDVLNDDFSILDVRWR